MIDMLNVYAREGSPFDIGRLGENEHRRVCFDIADYLAMYPSATFTLLFQPHGSDTAYPVASVTHDAEYVYWVVESSELTAEGLGRCELLVLDGDVVAKTIIYLVNVLPALDGSGEAPEPWESWQTTFAGLKDDAVAAAQDAEAASQAVQDMGVEASTLEAGASATVEKSVDPDTGAVTLAFGIPTGPRGETGQTGPAGKNGSDGADGVSPTVTVTDISGGHRVTITDADGAKTFDVMNGAEGQTGPAGADGYSPSASVSKSGATATITITDKSGTTTAQISDGQNGQNGAPGADGYSPTATVTKSGDTATISITDKFGTTTATVSDGQNGTNGTNGVSPSVSVTSITGGHQIAITDAQGTETFNVMDGADGASGAMIVETVSGTTPTITAADNHRYVCGEVSTLDITLPASGIIDVVFQSGATPTVLTVTPPTGVTVKWTNGFDPTSLEANTTYEINVMDGVYGVVASWT